MLRKILCLAATALLTQAASADVLYTWQQVEHSPSVPDGLRLELLFTDEAVARGSFDLALENRCSSGVCDQQQDSLLALRYSFAGADGTRSWNTIDYRIGDETRPGLQRISLGLQFLPGGLLDGSIMANNGESDFTLAGDGSGLFTLVSAHSDQPFGCGFAYPSCSGERGRLVSGPVPGQPDGQPLPEPASLATLAIGALAALAARRRSTRRVNG
jgi:hypothetical protein